MHEYIQVTATLSSQLKAQRVAEQLVRERLAVSVQTLGPIPSIFWRKNQIESVDNWICRVQTRRDCYEAIEAMIRMLCPHDPAEVVALPLVATTEEYRSWVDHELDKPHGTTR